MGIHSNATHVVLTGAEAHPTTGTLGPRAVSAAWPAKASLVLSFAKEDGRGAVRWAFPALAFAASSSVCASHCAAQDAGDLARPTMTNLRQLT